RHDDRELEVIGNRIEAELPAGALAEEALEHIKSFRRVGGKALEQEVPFACCRTGCLHDLDPSPGGLLERAQRGSAGPSGIIEEPPLPGQGELVVLGAGSGACAVAHRSSGKLGYAAKNRGAAAVAGCTPAGHLVYRAASRSPGAGTCALSASKGT